MKPILTLPIKNDIALPTTDQDSLVIMEQAFFRGIMPLPPSVNQSYKIVHIGQHQRIGPTAALEQFKEDAAKKLTQSFINQDVLQAIQTAPFKTPLAATLIAYFATEWKRDLDGIIKAGIDAAFLHLGINDHLVIDIHAIKRVDRDNPRVEIELRCIAR